MADWQRTIDIKESWDMTCADAMPTHALAKEIAKKMRALEPLHEPKFNSTESWINHKLDDVAQEFENFAEEESDDLEWFDHAMRELYDWADIALDNKFGGKKNCWIKTF